MSIGSFFRDKISDAAGWVGGAIGGAIGGPEGAAIGKGIGEKVGGLFTKLPGASEQPWSPINTSVGIPSYGGRMSSYKAGAAQAPDVRMKTVDAETLNAEWEYRLTKGLRNRNLFT